MSPIRRRIDRLTPEQESRFGEFVERWTAIGLSTEPAGRPEAECGILEAYRIAGLAPPSKIIWCGSPLSQGLTRAIVFGLKPSEVSVSVGASVGDSIRDSVGASIRDSVWASVWDSVWDSVGDSVGASVGASVWDSVGDSVWASVWASVRDSVWASVWASVRALVWASVRDSVGASVGDSVRASVRASVGASVGDSVGDSVRASVGASVGDSVRDSVWDSVRASVRDSVGASVGASVWASVRDSVGDSVWDSVYGQHDAGWLGFYDYFRDACGLSEETRRLCGLWCVARNAGWWLPHEKICWISERPCRLNRDDRGRLHSTDGPALLYPDGFGIWAWHGVRVRADIIEQPGSITVAAIESERNAEVRRIMVERYGPARYLADSGAVLVHRDDWGSLYRKDQPGDEPLVMVQVVNATREPDDSFRDYWLRVHPELRPLLSGGRTGEPQAMTARNAVASTFGLRGEEYAPCLQS